MGVETGEVTYIAAIDQGTTSSRCTVLDEAGRAVAVDQREHRQILPRAGMGGARPGRDLAQRPVVHQNAVHRARITRTDLAAIGITNQRETTVLWDRRTGEPVHNAIVWQDTRTTELVTTLGDDALGGQDRFRVVCDLLLATLYLPELPSALLR